METQEEYGKTELKIVQLNVENVKKIKAVQIKPDGSLVVIGGENAAGKSSVLDAIAYALGGTKLCPAMPIRKGETSAKVVVDLGEMTVERTFTPKGSYLAIKNKDGVKAQSPQKLLEKICGRLSFDPLAFCQMAPVAQLAALREIVGLDFSTQDEQRRQFYEKRAEVNRDMKRLAAQAAGAPKVDAPAEEVSVTGLVEKLRTALDHNREREQIMAGGMEAIQDELDDSNKMVMGFDADIQEFQAHIAALEGVRAEKLKKIEILKGQQREVQDEYEAFKRADTGAIQEEIAEAAGINAAVRQNQARAKIEAEVAVTAQTEAGLTKAIADLDMDKMTALAAAKFPVDGLSFGEAGITYKGIPFEQAAASEQMRVSVMIGFAMNPALKVVLVRDGSLLDLEHLEELGRLATAQGGQVWIERVGTGEEVSVIIKDGAVQTKKEAEDK